MSSFGTLTIPSIQIPSRDQVNRGIFCWKYKWQEVKLFYNMSIIQISSLDHLFFYLSLSRTPLSPHLSLSLTHTHTLLPTSTVTDWVIAEDVIVDAENEICKLDSISKWSIFFLLYTNYMIQSFLFARCKIVLKYGYLVMVWISVLAKNTFELTGLLRNIVLS